MSSPDKRHERSVSHDFRKLHRLVNSAGERVDSLVSYLNTMSPDPVQVYSGFSPAGSGSANVLFGSAVVSSTKAVVLGCCLTAATPTPATSAVTVANATSGDDESGTLTWTSNGRGQAVIELDFDPNDEVVLTVATPTSTGVNMTLILLPADSNFTGEIDIPDYGV